MKKCFKCGISKNINEFPRKGNKCRSCVHDYYQMPEQKVHKQWFSISYLAGNKRGKDPTYQNVKLKITKDEFVDWYIDAVKLWRAAHPAEKEAVARINLFGDYELDNLEILELGESRRRKPCNLNVHAPTGFSWCNKCHSYRPIAEFTLNNERVATKAEYICSRHKKINDAEKYYALDNYKRKMKRLKKRYGIEPVYKGVQLQ